MKNKALTNASVITAGLASLCCIGPLVAVGLGLGAFGASALFEELRPYLLGVTAALLGTAFYFAYRKPSAEACADGSCAVAPGKKSRKVTLWLVTALVVPLAAFPYYSTLFWTSAASGGTTAPMAASSPPGSAQVVFEVDGMTCPGCAAEIQETMRRHPGVTTALVDFEAKTAQLVYNPAVVSVAQLSGVIADLGFTVSPRMRDRKGVSNED